jgi:hypothetical protein
VSANSIKLFVTRYLHKKDWQMLTRLTLIGVFILMAITTTPTPSFAQDDAEKIEYGTIVTGEITNREFEIPYLFDGEEDDVIVIEMKQADFLNDLNSPSLILLDADFDVIASTYGYSSTVLALSLPEDGEYTILATRADGRSGDSVGEYILSLNKPTPMAPFEIAEDDITTEETDYFLVSGYSEFSIIYTRVNGEFAPQITINIISDEGDLEELAYLAGDKLAGGTLSIDEREEVFIITVAEPLFSFYFEDVRTDYTLALQIEKDGIP